MTEQVLIRYQFHW